MTPCAWGDGSAVAWWRAAPSGNLVVLCQRCLDAWFDLANDDGLEPAAWSWLPGLEVAA